MPSESCAEVKLGETDTEMAAGGEEDSVICAEADFVLSATEVAVSVKLAACGTPVGAAYDTAFVPTVDSVPQVAVQALPFWVKAQVTPLF